MKKILKTLPSDWLYQLITLSIITASSFYLLQFIDKSETARAYWEMNEKFYIYTFLGLQFIVKAFFYWILFLIVKKLLFHKIKSKVLRALNEPKSMEDMRFIVEIWQFIVLVFGIPIELGLISREDLQEKIEMTEEELEDMMKSMVKWACVFIHVACTAILIWHLSAFYIIPLLVGVILVIATYWIGLTFLFGNIKLIERARVELVKNKSLPK